MKWFVKCIKNYATFRGRARRSEYWYFVLYGVIFSILAMILDCLVFGTNSAPLFGPKTQIFSSLFSLFIFLPSLAVLVRRMHDTGRSGKVVMWYYISAIVWVVAMLITGASILVSIMQGTFSSVPIAFIVVTAVGGLVMLVWAIILLVWACTEGTVGDNKYGPDPKAVEQ